MRHNLGRRRRERGQHEGERGLLAVGRSPGPGDTTIPIFHVHRVEGSLPQTPPIPKADHTHPPRNKALPCGHPEWGIPPTSQINVDLTEKAPGRPTARLTRPPAARPAGPGVSRSSFVLVLALFVLARGRSFWARGPPARAYKEVSDDRTTATKTQTLK